MAGLMEYFISQTREALKNADKQIIREIANHIHESLMYEYDGVEEIENAIWDYIRTKNKEGLNGK